ncbi:MAG: glycosyltransferase family 4 protein [Solirubrobacteraceae bacterium]
MRIEEFVAHYGLELAEAKPPDPTPREVGFGTAVEAALRRRVRPGRRLAWLDNTFPWRGSGFRYHEALAIHELRPDTLFFASYRLADPFPVPVHHVSDFGRRAARHGITDVYGVFQLFLEGLVGMHDRTVAQEAFPGPDISQALRRLRLRLHGMVYPGGGFVPTQDGFERVRALATRLSTTFSYVPEVLDAVPGAVAVPQALTATGFYRPSTGRWSARTPLVCLFAADDPPRKGLDTAIAAFRDLNPTAFHLHVVGPHEHRRAELPEPLATFHGWLEPEQLAELHRRVHVFLSPVRAEPPGPRGSHAGVTDGFPTQAAADAMSSGCLLVSSNPADDHRVLSRGTDYVPSEATPAAVRDAVLRVAADLPAARRVAERGQATVRERMDIRRSTELKLRHMGLFEE